MTFWDVLLIIASGAMVIAADAVFITVAAVGLWLIHHRFLLRTSSVEEAKELAGADDTQKQKEDGQSTVLVDLFEVPLFDPESTKTIRASRDPGIHPVSWPPKRQETRNDPGTPVAPLRR